MSGRRTDPYWSRVVVGLCCLYGLWLGFDTTLGSAATLPPLGVMLVIAATVTATAGHSRFKLAAAGALAAVFLAVATAAAIAQ